MMRAELNTFAAAKAAFFVVNMLRCDGPSFRIVAPPDCGTTGRSADIP
jgi:hypothetical protein